MARPLRLEAPGEFSHVLARGNSRLPIFEDDRDRIVFLDLLLEVTERFDVRCHAYCLMGNHYHLLVQPMAGGLPRALRQLNGVYAQRFNRRHQRAGHLFEGRYKSILVDRQSYLLELARYIVLNPVRAKLVEMPEAWRWSSYTATAGLAPPPPFLTVDFIRRAAGGREGALGASDFRALVSLGMLDPVRDAQIEALLSNGGVAGTPPFAERVAREMPPSPSQEIPGAQRQVGRPPIARLFGCSLAKPERDARIRVAVLRHGYTQAAVAAALGLGRNTVSRIVRKAATSGRRFLD